MADKPENFAQAQSEETSNNPEAFSQSEKTSIRPELLSPARDFEQLIMSLNYGADAVYLAGKRFGLRASAGNFTPDEMREAVRLCHERGARTYVACNAVMNNDDVLSLPAFFEELCDIKADAVIVSDIGAVSLLKKYAPSLDIHISTQAGVFNSETAKTLYDMGAERVILARELPLYEIEKIRERTPPGLELEAFVHGSMCVSISGRCLLSNYLSGRDANRGACSQPCRWKYHVMEESRPGEFFDVSEDSGGTYLFNSRDLRMIDHLDKMLKAGITSLKIEGRMKSAYYAAVITNAYRHAIDEVLCGKIPDKIWREETEKVSHREYSTGFYLNPEGPGQVYKDSMYSTLCDVAAIVETCDERGNASLTQRNKFCKGDELEILTPSGKPVKFYAAMIFDEKGSEIEQAPHPMMRVCLKLPVIAPKYSIVRKYRQV